MIRIIDTVGKYITAKLTPAFNYAIQSETPAASPGVTGDIRWNYDCQNMEVYNGVKWTLLNGNHFNIGLTVEAEQAIEWARIKRQEEIELAQLADEHPAIRIALTNLINAKEQLEITNKLSREYEL